MLATARPTPSAGKNPFSLLVVHTIYPLPRAVCLQADYANTRQDAAAIGFDDDFIYHEIALRPEDRQKAMERLLPQEAIKAFEMWQNSKDKVEY